MPLTWFYWHRLPPFAVSCAAARVDSGDVRVGLRRLRGLFRRVFADECEVDVLAAYDVALSALVVRGLEHVGNLIAAPDATVEERDRDVELRRCCSRTQGGSR